MAQNEVPNAPSLRDRVSQILNVPRPIKALFDAVPVITYPANELPERSPEASELPCLYIFSTEQDAKAGRPSYNPGCLKYQTALRMAGMPFTVTPSSNHASPTGSLPFLLPPTSSPLLPAARLPITQEKILNHASKHGHVLRALPVEKHVSSTTRIDAYLVMIDVSIRPAWLHSLYISPRNKHIVDRLYLQPTSSSWAVRKSIEHILRSAVQEQLILATPRARIDVDDIYARARQSLESFALVLQEEEEEVGEGNAWVLGGDGNGGPTLVDAALFAYTYLLLDESVGWKDKRLVTSVQSSPALVRHRDRILREFYGDLQEERS